MKIYVGNMSYDVTEEDLREACEAFGQIESVTIIKDKFTGQPKGFGFVEIPSKAEAQSAIDGLNGKELKGRTLKVNEATPPTKNRGDKGKYSDSKRGYGGDKGGYGGDKGGYGGNKGGYGGSKGGFSGGKRGHGSRGGRGR